ADSIPIGVDPLVSDYERFGISDHKMTYIGTGAENIPLPSKSIDCIFAFNSLDHVDDTRNVVEEIKRLIKPGGLFLMMVEINHKPTIQEPHTLRADFVNEFGFKAECVKIYRKTPEIHGVYGTLMKGEEVADDGKSDMWMTAKMWAPA
ncbi:MAG: class I SAM-dependent methyltransferase, partial [Pseudomonadales bacterium]